MPCLGRRLGTVARYGTARQCCRAPSCRALPWRAVPGWPVWKMCLGLVPCSCDQCMHACHAHVFSPRPCFASSRSAYLRRQRIAISMLHRRRSGRFCAWGPVRVPRLCPLLGFGSDPGGQLRWQGTAPTSSVLQRVRGPERAATRSQGPPHAVQVVTRFFVPRARVQ